MRKKKISERILASALATAMCINYIPVYAVAEEEKTESIISESENDGENSEITNRNSENSENETADKTEQENNNEVIVNNNPVQTFSDYAINLTPIPDEVSSMYEMDINGKDSLSVNDGEKAVLHLKIKEGAEKNYRISAVRIGNTAVDANNAENFEVEINVNSDIADENGNIQITADFTRVYTEKFYYNSEDKSFSVEEDTIIPDDVGKIVFGTGDEIGFSAVPSENYRVFSTCIDDSSKNYENNNQEISVNDFSPEENHYFEVTFANNRYSIETGENEQVKSSLKRVVHGGTAEIIFTPDDGYYLKSVTTNDKPIDIGDMQSGKITLEGITENQHIKAEFAKYSDDYSWNFSDALKVQGEKYLFANDKDVVFSTKQSGIRLIDENNAVISGGENISSVSVVPTNKKITISAVDIYYSGTGWRRASLDKPVEILFYEEMKADVILPEYDSGCSCYGGDVRLKIDIPYQNADSLISSVEYKIDNGEYHKIEDNKREILIDAENNNRADIVVSVLITDIMGNKIETKSEPFSINNVIPTVKISTEDKISDEADSAHYCNGRTFTVSVDDAEYTHSMDFSAFSIFKDGEELSDDEKSRIISWSSDGNKLTAFLRFSQDGKYNWNMQYTNTAGKHNEDIEESGDDIYSFVVDTSFEKALVKVNSETVRDVIDVLTFGIMGNSEIAVTAEAEDNLSGVKEIYFYKDVYTQERTSNKPLEFQELEQLYKENKFVPYSGRIVVSKDEKAVVYVRFVDGAGNIAYRSSDGMIIDATKSNIKITADTPNEFNIYDRDVNVHIDVTDAYPYSGIKSVEYMVKSGGCITQMDSFDEFDEDTSKYENLRQNFSGDIKISSILNNDSNVMLFVKVTDNAGNVAESEQRFDINTDNPSVTVSYDNNNVKNEKYFSSQRKAKIVINDRAGHFDPKTATESICISAVGKNKTPVENAFSISEWSSKGDTHTAEITFFKDAEYEFSVNYVSRSGHTSSAFADENQSAPFSFVIDKTAPSGSVKIQESTLGSVIDTITFGAAGNKNFEVSAEGSDNLSPVKMEYYISDTSENLDSKALDDIPKEKWQEYNGIFSIPNNDYSETPPDVYLKVSDYAGNYIYICSDGHIIDNQCVNIDIIYPLKKEIYSDDVNLSFYAVDKGSYSGIKEIEYWVTNDDKITQQDKVFSFDDLSESESVNIAKGKIKIDSKLNNGSNIMLYVRAVDNAGNENTVSAKLDIDITKPEICVDYNEQKGSGDCFSSPRQAEITIVERQNHFDPKTASESIKITAKDADGKDVENAWTLSNWESDGDIHKAVINYIADARYEFSISYKDKAGNVNDGVNTGNSKYPYEFTIDKTAPAGSLKALSRDDKFKEWDNQFSEGEEVYLTVLSKTAVNVSADVTDNLSGISETAYFKDVISEDFEKLSAKTRTFHELESIYEGNIKGKNFEVSQDGITVNENEKAVVYARITDNAGNVKYLNTDIIVVDTEKPCLIGLTPMKNEDEPETAKNTFNKTALFKVEVKDDLSDNKAFSGIDEVWYTIKKDDNIITNERLYKWNAGVENTLRRSYSSFLELDPKRVPEYNQDNLEVSVFVKDRAGNEYGDDKIDSQISMNTDKLKCTVEFEDEFNDNRSDESCFTSRTAKIKIENDRDSSFDEEAFVNAIINSIDAENITDEYGKRLNSKPENLVSLELSSEFDSDVHYAVVKFNYCGNYTWKKSKYVNKAENTTDILKDDLKFTIDKVAPKGEISIDGSTWDSLFEAISFGLYKFKSFDVSISGRDNLNDDVSIYYFISNSEKNFTFNELEKLSAEKWTAYEGTFTIDKIDKYVVYAKITDNSGNHTYICSDRHTTIDNDPPKIDLKLDGSKNEVYDGSDKIDIYNGDVTATVKVTDELSGVQSAEYWITKNNSEEETKHEPIHGESEIIIKAKDYNCPIVLHVKAKDNMGKECEVTKNIDIDITPPSVSVEYDNNKDNNGNTYFNNTRTATVSIKERSSHFDPKDVIIGITAEDIDQEIVEDAYEISAWETIESKTNPDEDIHKIQIKYLADANYSFDISYTDKAGNKNSEVQTGKSVAPFKFTVDTTPPTGTATAVSAEGREESWDRIADILYFGFWSNQNIRISAEGYDQTSGIDYVKSYNYASNDGVSATQALDKNALEKITNWQDINDLTMYPNGQFTTYFKIADMAGNISYVSTNGLILDDTSPVGEVNAPEITVTPEQTKSGIYNSDVNVAVTVDDVVSGGGYSGIKTVSYRVLNMGKETQSGTLFEFSGDNPLQSELQKTWSGEITVNSSTNNSNDVVIEIYAEDNAGNATVNSTSIKIDVTPPSIFVGYDNNLSVGNLFKSKRTAMITIKERNFGNEYVNLSLTHNGEEYSQALDWSSAGGSGDDTLWYAELPFEADGDYTFSIKCTDMASNASEKTVFDENSICPDSFTIDCTMPTIDVYFHDDSRYVKQNYYRENRTATITINEEHFDPESASKNIVIKGDNDGSEVTARLGEWSDDGNLHTMDILFENDGAYSMSVSYTDIAGNIAEPYSTDFYIDKTDPSVSVKINEKQGFGAYKDEVLPVIDYHDVNLDENEVSVEMMGGFVQVSKQKESEDEIVFKLERKSENDETEAEIEWKAKIVESEGHYGKTIIFDNFPEGEDFEKFDDIYTINVSVSDKSGRNSSHNERFSVNRYGSTYNISENTRNMIGQYLDEEEKVDVEEINPDELTDYSVTLFKNNETEKLSERNDNANHDYSVDSKVDDKDWHSYTYNVREGNFSDDGIYSVNLHSIDKAGNISENTLDTKKSDINFAIDKTPPTVSVINIEDNGTYIESSKEVIFMADDNIKLSSIKVYIDQKNINDKTKANYAWNSDEIERMSKDENNKFKNQYSFKIDGNSNDAHNVTIICRDATGSKNGVKEVEIKNFYVTTNPVIPWLRKYGWILGVIGAVGVILGIMKVKKRNNGGT